MRPLLLGGFLLVALGPVLVAHAWERAGRQALAARWRDVATTTTTDALRGYKVAQVLVGAGGRAWLAGVAGHPYPVDDVARCDRRTCRPPGLDCRCGFHALRDRAEAAALLDRLTRRHPHRSYVLLVVDLDGDVLEHEHGFRGERQRVHRVEVPTDCVACRRDGVRRPAGALRVHPALGARQAIDEAGFPLSARLPRGCCGVHPLCADHDPGPGGRTLTTAALRGLLGTEVVWT